MESYKFDEIEKYDEIKEKLITAKVETMETIVQHPDFDDYDDDYEEPYIKFNRPKRGPRSKKNITTEKGPEAAGNTKPAAQIRARSFQFTLNDIDKYEKVKNKLMEYKNFRYLISCKEEAPTTGKEHIHIYVNYKEKTRITPSKLYGAHIEICKGSPKQNIDYIKKDGHILDEIGDKPAQGRYSSKDLLKTPISDIIDNEAPHVAATLIKLKEKLSQGPLLNSEAYKPDLEVYYIYGPSGKGKSLLAHKLIGNNYYNEIDYKNGFYIGLNNDIADIALYDDFRQSDMKASEFIKLIDYNVHQMNIKGGCVKNTFKKIIITSLQNPTRIFNKYEDEEKKQWLRRMNIINIEEWNQLNGLNY